MDSLFATIATRFPTIDARIGFRPKGEISGPASPAMYSNCLWRVLASLLCRFLMGPLVGVAAIPPLRPWGALKRQRPPSRALLRYRANRAEELGISDWYF